MRPPGLPGKDKEGYVATYCPVCSAEVSQSLPALAGRKKESSSPPSERRQPSASCGEIGERLLATQWKGPGSKFELVLAQLYHVAWGNPSSPGPNHLLSSETVKLSVWLVGSRGGEGCSKEGKAPRGGRG